MNLNCTSNWQVQKSGFLIGWEKKSKVKWYLLIFCQTLIYIVAKPFWKVYFWFNYIQISVHNEAGQPKKQSSLTAPEKKLKSFTKWPPNRRNSKKFYCLVIPKDKVIEAKAPCRLAYQTKYNKYCSQVLP